MSSTAEQESAVERLYENEALIDNLIADVAKPVLAWAEQQLLAGVDAEAIFAAVRAVNDSDPQDAASALATAQQALAPATVEAMAPTTPSPAVTEGQTSAASPASNAAPVPEEKTLTSTTAEVAAPAAPTEEPLSKTIPVSNAAPTPEEKPLTPVTVAPTAPVTPPPAPDEEQPATTSTAPTLAPVTAEKVQPPEEPKPHQDDPQVSVPTAAKTVGQLFQSVDKAPTPTDTPVATHSKPVNEPPQVSDAQRQATRVFLQRLMGWLKPQNK